MKKTFVKIMALTLAFVLTVGMVGCGGGGENPDAGDRTVVYFQASHVTAQEQAAYT